jgi:transposase
MRRKSKGLKEGAEATARDIRRRTRRQYSAEEKIRIVLAGLTCRGCGDQIDLTQEPWKGEVRRLWNAAHDRGPAHRRLP